MKKISGLFLSLIISLLFITACNSTIEFLINFEVDGELYKTISTDGNESISMPTDPEKEGYIFDGWYWDKDTWNRPFTANSLLEEKLTSNMTVYAKWKEEITPIDDYLISANNFTINNSNLNTTVPNSTSSFSFINQVIFKENFTFTVATDIEGNDIVSSKIISLLPGDNIVYILAKSNSDTVSVYNVTIRRKPLYTITFSDEIQFQIVEEDNVALIPDEPVKAGYVFDKWLNDGTEYNFDTPVTSNMNINAYWIANNYTIEFDANKPTNAPTNVSGNMQDLQCSYNTTEALSLNTYSLEGYSFAGWTISADGSGTVYSNGQNISNLTTIPNDTVTLYAKWNINSYNVTLNRNITVAGTVNGSGSKVYNSTVTITATTNEGYTWLGWYDGDAKVSEGTSLSYTFIMPAESKTYEARWILCPVALVKNISAAGTVSGVSGATAVGAETTITATTNAGYTWQGWYDGETEITTDLSYTFTMPAENETYEARWRLSSASISYNANGGIGTMIGGSITTGDPLSPNTFTKTDYTFKGWSLTSDGIVAYSNQAPFIVIEDGATYTLYAQWSPYTRSDNYIWFGEYPQTIKEDIVTVGDTADSQGYFLGSDGARYAKVVASPYGGNYTFSNDSTVTSGTTYYFKVEPIKWKILNESNGTAFILAELIIDNHRYAASSNNYMNSEIRAWLNNQFYNTAFNDLQKQIILITNVDNSVASTGYATNQYACANTNDKVFLLSYAEATNTSYGFSSSGSSHISRERITSDYSRSKGAFMNKTAGSEYGKGNWWLRSPIHISYVARYVLHDGSINGNNVGNADCGVVPALKIQLS